MLWKLRDLKDYLGPPKLYDLSVPKTPERGNIVGLAWTEAGGDVLLIEAVTMRGKGCNRSLTLRQAGFNPSCCHNGCPP